MEISGSNTFSTGGQTRTFRLLPFTFTGKVHYKDGLYYFYNFSSLWVYNSTNQITFLDIYTTPDFITYTKINNNPLSYVDVIFDIVVDTPYFYDYNGYLYTLNSDFSVATLAFNTTDTNSGHIINGNLFKFYVEYGTEIVAVAKFVDTDFSIIHESTIAGIGPDNFNLNTVVKKLGSCIIVLSADPNTQLTNSPDCPFGISLQSLDNGDTWNSFVVDNYPMPTSNARIFYETIAPIIKEDGIYVLSIGMNYLYYGETTSTITLTLRRVPLNGATGYYDTAEVLGSTTHPITSSSPITLSGEEISFFRQFQSYIYPTIISNNECVCLLTNAMPAIMGLGSNPINFFVCSFT